MENQILAIRNPESIAVPQRINELSETFISAQDVKENSKMTYRKALKQFMQWIAENNEQHPNRDAILRYKKYLESKELSACTCNCYLTVVRKFFKWANATIGYPIISDVKGCRKPKGFRKDPLTKDQVHQLLAGIDRSTIEGKRNASMLTLMIATGLRTVELTRANIADIHQESGTPILSIQGKGRDTKDEIVLLTTGTLQTIQDYLKERGVVADNEPLFISHSNKNDGARLSTRTISRVAKEGLRAIGLNNSRYTAHSLRHSAATLAYLGGADLQSMKQMMRHSSCDTTQIYIHAVDRIKNAAEFKIDSYLNGGL